MLLNLFKTIAGIFRYPTTGRRTKNTWMNSTLSHITLCNNRAKKQPILLGPGWKCLPKQLVYVRTETGASAAQHPLQHNQISCGKHHRLNLHHNTETVFTFALILHSHSDPSSQPTNAVQFEVVPNAWADTIRQQPANRQLECSLTLINIRILSWNLADRRAVSSNPWM